MFVKISKVISTCGDESIVDIWINASLIIKIEPVSYNNSIVKSLIYMKDVEAWDYIRCSMTPEEIVETLYGGISQNVISQERINTMWKGGAK